MFQYHTISNEEGTIELTALFNDGKYSISSIVFKKLKNKEFPDQELFWDNDDFIFGKFRRFLRRWQRGRLKKKDQKKFEEIWNILDDETVDEILLMLETAFNLKWYGKENLKFTYEGI